MTKPNEPPHVPKGLFQAVDCQRFGAATCFLCGRRLGSRNRADEHVFPRWVLERYDIWDDQLTLLNGTHIPYRQLLVPCCRDCNNTSLSQLERRVQAAVDSGVEAVEALSRLDLMIWLGKIFYGILYKEGFLRRNRKRARAGRIITRGMLERFAMHHYFLQAVRVPMRFDGPPPCSIFTFTLQAPGEPRDQFDFRDSIDGLAVSLRLGNVGILAALQDGGAQRGYADHLAQYQKVELHPLQFIELTAQFFYKCSLFSRTPKFILAATGDHIVVHQLPLGGLSAQPLFDDWDHRRYADVLAFQTGFPVERLYHPSGGVTSWLHGESGDVPVVDLVAQPWPASGLDDNLQASQNKPNSGPAA